VKAVDLVQSGSADIAVTDHLVAGLHASQIAWDGVAVIVNFANPIRELTSRQLKAVFAGQMMRWSEVAGANEKIEILDRAPEDNVKTGFEASLGITNQIPPSALVLRTDQKALRAVSGTRSAITYLSLAAALRAQEDGIPIQVLTIDGVEPGQPTLRNGTYGLRRPIYFLSQTKPGPVAESFLAFAQSVEAEQYMKSVFIPIGSPSGIGTKDLGRIDRLQPHPDKRS
jgi:phosphate transport system substrate-binding protein